MIKNSDKKEKTGKNVRIGVPMLLTGVVLGICSALGVDSDAIIIVISMLLFVFGGIGIFTDLVITTDGAQENVTTDDTESVGVKDEAFEAEKKTSIRSYFISFGKYVCSAPKAFFIPLLLLLVVISVFVAQLSVTLRTQYVSEQAVIDARIEADKELEELRSDILELTSNRYDIKNSLKEEQEDYDAFKVYLSEKEALEEECQSLQARKGELLKEVSKLDGEIAKKKETLDVYDGKIAEAKGRGFKLSSGFYTGGEDIPVGTYNIIATKGKGNVFVDDPNGRSIVNEMFGKNSSYYIEEFKNVPIGYGSKIEVSGCTVTFKSVE